MKKNKTQAAHCCLFSLGTELLTASVWSENQVHGCLCFLRLYDISSQPYLVSIYGVIDEPRTNVELSVAFFLDSGYFIWRVKQGPHVSQLRTSRLFFFLFQKCKLFYFKLCVKLQIHLVLLT